MTGEGAKGPSVNNFTALGRKGHYGICNDSNEALILKSVTLVRGSAVSNLKKIHDFIYR